MVMKAQDQSISKVLDWFSRSSEIGDNPPPPVGMLQPSKGTSSQILIQAGGNKKESGPNEKNLKTVSEPTSYLESPNTAEKQKSRLSILGMQSGDYSDIPNVKLPAAVGLVEDNGVPSGHIEFSYENGSPVQYGNGGGGSGKISTQEANAMQDNGQCQEAKYLDISEVGKEGYGTEVPKVTLTENRIPVATEFMANHQIPEMVEKPHSRSSLSSTDTNNDQSDINDELLTKANSIEIASPPRVNNSNLEAGNWLEFGKSGSGSGKTFLPSQEVSEIKEPRLSSSTDINDDQLDIKNGQPLTQANSIENAFPPRVMNSNLEADNCLEYGTSGGESGKTSSPSQEISTVKKPRLSLSSTDTDDDQSGINNDELLTQTSKENVSPPRLINLNLEADNCLEYGTSGGGSGKTSSPSQEISTVKKPRLSLSSTDTDDDQSGINNDELLTQTSKENVSPPRLINLNLEADNCLEYGTSGGESGKTSSPSQEISTVKKPRLSLSSTDTDDDQSGINNELLTQTSKENVSPPRLINLNLEADNCLEYGTSGGESGKTSSPSQEISTVKKPRLSLSSTDTDDDQSGINNDELLTQTSKENVSPPRLINLNLEADNCLEYGTSGGGSGKTSSPSQEISTVKKPRLSLSSTDTDDDQSGINNELLTQTSKENVSPPRLINLNLEADNCLEYGMSGGGSDKPVSPNQEIPDVRKPRLSLSSTDSTNHDPSETGNVDLLTPVHVMEEESVPPAKMYPVENSLDLGKSKGEAGTMSNQAADYTQTDPQLKEVGKEVFEGEKESNFLKEEPQIQRVVEAETLEMDTENRPLDGSQPENVEYIKILEVPPSDDTVNFNVHQRKVSDIKQLWEGDKSALPAAKTSLSSSKQMLSPSERSITPQRSLIESDDRSSPSLVTFKRVMVEEEEEHALLPVDQLKSFWENEKNKEVVNAKQLDGSLVKNGSLDAEEVSALAESRSKFKKRHTFHSFFEKEQNTSTDKNPPSRSVSLSESTNDNLKDRHKSTTFQNLRSFWNVDHKANPNDRALSDAKNRQFRSNPDLSKVSFVARIKSKLESQSLEDIREDTIDTYQVQPVKDVHDHKNKTPPLLSTFTKQKSSDNSLRNSVEAQEKISVFQDCNPIEFTSVSKAQTKSKSSFEVPDHKKEVSEVVVKSAQRTEKVNEFSLRLQKLRNEFSDKSLEGTTSVNFKYKPKNDEMAARDVENQNLAVNKNGEGMAHEECERRQTLVKQIGLDENSPVGTEAFHFLKNSNGKDNLKNVQTQVDNGEHVYETVERTRIPPPKHSADFNRGLQKLYNESLAPVSEVKLSQNEFMNIQSPEENFSKVLTVSSSKIKSNVQRASSKERSSSFQQPIVINLSSTKMNVGNEATGKHSVNLDAETETSIAKDNDLTPAEKKEIVEKIEIPKVVPRAPFNHFDEGLKKLYDESRDLTATKPVSGSLQTLPAKEDLVMHESVTSVSQAPDILEQEIGETIGKASAPTKMYHAKSSEKDQKEDVNDEEEPFMENVPSNHVTSEESQQRFSEHIVSESTVSEMSPKGKEASVQENVQSLQYETIQESPSKTDSPFTDMRHSSPMKEKGNSLRKSTLELYLEVPYRREMSKSMDFELGGYIASDVDIDGYQLNSSSPTEDIPVNSFPQNAETLKRLSQSVPAFINDDICHCTPVLIVCKTVDTDGRDTDSASESSFQIGRHKKSPSSLTNLSGSSGMASMSSVSGSVMSIYSGDFGNVDIKGGIEFSIDYVEQLKEFLIYIYQCRELAVAEPKKQRSDPYVKAYLLPEKAKMGKRKTAVKKKTLNPVYNEILRYKIPKQSLLAQALNLSVWHHDALGRNSFLGEVNVNLGTWDWSDTQRKWYQLEARTPAAGIGLENRGEMKLSLKYVPMSSSASGSKPNLTGEVHISIKDCLQLPMLRENKINSFVKCTVLPDTSRKSRQRTRTVDKTPNPYFNHTMVYDGFKAEDLREACVELTVWDHNRLSNHFLGGIRIGLGTGKSYGTPVDWMDSTPEEAIMWEKMMTSPNTWIDGMLPLRMFKMAKLAK
ncbi:synaptotagmin-like protein 2 isoform X2 [Rana temporaria]|uniref:synaptotagmin-like protein 2 isoform X2 n=1 Tax=Rana temporaria TaxID=8407 RepID=UPI001AADC4A5|nr:synaptotagmin-like protein 2 isoform X2 [Rana temporaria]